MPSPRQWARSIGLGALRRWCDGCPRAWRAFCITASQETDMRSSDCTIPASCRVRTCACGSSMAAGPKQVLTGPFARVLGTDFAELPAALRNFHGVGRFRRFVGKAVVEVSTGPVAQAALWIAGFPRRGGTVQLEIEVEARDGRETWRRDFGGTRTRSTLEFRDGEALETFGPVTCALDIRRDGERILVGVKRAWIFGLMPLPRGLRPVSASVEWSDDRGRFCFDINAALPGLGPLIRYHGHLVPTSD